MAEGKDVIDALANKYTSMWSNGDANKRTDIDLKIIKMLDVDAAINFLHWGCKNCCSIATLTKDTLNEEMGIPVLELDGDVVDPRNYASAQIRTRIEAFIEMLK
ncbi:MAG: 2-hydroxyacyl-CoA dehydratase [Candidatus Helarchaeota archaeon]|nr:2-hydroxyacyl-CoA dehydratase [Candidatus Helarchaeota archaeon]